MNLFEDGLSLFGLQIKSKKTDDNLTAALSTEENEDGAAIVAAANSAAYNGVFFDVDGTIKDEQQAIQKYRDISLFPEIDIAIQDIVNEAMPQEDDDVQVKLNLDGLDFSLGLKDKIHDEFETVLNLLNYNTNSADVFRKWYIDGRLFYQIIVDKENPQKGISKLIAIDSLKMKKIKEVSKKVTGSGVQVIDKVEEYYVYSESGFGAKNNTNKSAGTSGAQGLKISKDSVVYVPSGFIDSNSGMMLGYLHKAIRPCNQLRMLEDATVVYFIARAPERRVFYVDVGNLPKLKAEQYMKDIMNRFRNKMVYDAKTGDVRDDKKYMSMLEDFWMPRRDGGKGTEITTLDGAQNITGYLDSLEWFKNKLYESLNIPTSRLQAEAGFNLGRSSEISRDELKFQKFIDRMRMKFSVLFMETLKTQLILKGICNDVQWEDIRDKIKFEFQRDNFFAEFKEQELWQSRFDMLTSADAYLLKYFSKNWVWKNILKFSDDEIERMQEEMESEIGDASAAPSFTDPMTGQVNDPTLAGGNGEAALNAVSPAGKTASANPPQPGQDDGEDEDPTKQ